MKWDRAEEEVNDLVDSLDIRENVKTISEYKQEYANKLYQGKHVLLHPMYNDACPTVTIEAMASGKAIIASNIPNIKVIVKHGKEAILVNPYDAEELKQAILLLYNNSDLRAELGRNAEMRAEVYNIYDVCGQVLELYGELIHDA